jgi:small-conductance mechanosensitive channel
LGRIQIQFSIPIGQDADHACDIVTAAFAEHQAVLDAPAPAVFIDSIADGRILFNCFAHVDNPRAAYRARSELLAHLLRRFREDGIELGTVPQRLEIVPAAPET